MSGDYDEDPGVTAPIEEIHDVMTNYEWESWDEVHAIVQKLLSSPPYWYEASIWAIHYPSAIKLTFAIRKVGMIKIDGSSAHDIFVGLYFKVQSHNL